MGGKRAPAGHAQTTRLTEELAALKEKGVVGVRMGDDGAVDGLPGIDVEIAGRAIEAGRRGREEV